MNEILGEVPNEEIANLIGSLVNEDNHKNIQLDTLIFQFQKQLEYYTNIQSSNIKNEAS